MEDRILKAALKYRELGYSVIPVKASDKKPYVKWTQFQTRKPNTDEIKQWLQKWPEANVAIVTGEISGLTVVDIDSDEGKDAVEEYLPDNLITPSADTPRGKHLYFQFTPGIPNKAKIITDCDTRTTGGYIIAPPSKNRSKVYTWLDGLNPIDVNPIPMPEMLADILRGASPASPSEQYINKVCTNTNVFSLGEDNIKERQQMTTLALRRDTGITLFSTLQTAASREA